MSSLELTLFILASAVLGVVVFRMLNLPPILGYLTVGIVIGPHGLGLFENSESTRQRAEIGVVFLMFSIGLEFSMTKLMAMRRSVFGLGFAQVALTLLLTFILAMGLNFFMPASLELSWQAAIALGGALAMSSTAIVSKLLTERLELDTPHGRKTFGILLFQDLALVPLLIIVPALADHSRNITTSLGLAALKAAIVLFLLLVIGNRLIRIWFRIVVKRRSQELFMLNLLWICLGAAWITERAGLSMALGAFVAGMLISDTEYKHHVEEDIKPFRDVLLGLFFVTIGMLLDLQIVIEYWWIVLLALLALLALKSALIAAIARFFGAPLGTSLRTGLILAQTGEFGFVLLNQAGDLKLLAPEVTQIILAVMVLSMMAAPLIIANADRIVLKLSSAEWMNQSLALTEIASRTLATQQHVLIAGFGRSGQSLATLLEDQKIAYHALDLDPDRVREALAAGANVSYGDAGRRESLIAAGIHRASALVITFAQTESAMKILHLVAELAPTLAVIVRSHDERDLDKLRMAGAVEVVPEIIEGSLMLASHTLMVLGVPLRRVLHREQKAREARYAALRGYFYGESDFANDLDRDYVRLSSIILNEDAAAIGHTLEELDLAQYGVDIMALRRNRQNISTLHDTRLQAADVVVLRGVSENIARAEQRLMK